MKTGKKNRTVSTRIVYKNPWIVVHEDQILRINGDKGVYGWVETLPTVGIVPIDKNGYVCLCKQWRHIFKEESWEIPRGFIDKGETALSAALRELEEEAGLKASSATKISIARPSIGLISEECSIFITTTFVNLNKHENEISRVKKIKLEQALEEIKKGRIKDGLTITALLLTQEYLNT